MTTALDTMFGAWWLMQQEFAPIEYVVPNMIPEGMTLVVAAPKVGKSWLVLGLGLALSGGGKALGVVPVGKPRPVLYCALEDGPRRLQSRLRALHAEEPTDMLKFVTTLKVNVLETIQAFVTMYAEYSPVVIVDTLGKVQPPANQGESAYERDYRVGSALKAVADSTPGASVIVVHHSRKAGAEDFLDTVSGTQGLAGSADTICVLKRDRLGREATFSVTSRDAAEGEYALRLEEAGTWILDGVDLDDAAGTARDRKITAGVGDRMAEVIATVGEHPEGIRPKDLKLLLPDVTGLDEYLRRAHEANRIAKLSRGLYAPVRSVIS